MITQHHISEASYLKRVLTSCFQEQIRRGVLTKTHGAVDPSVYGGLSESIVWKLCDHLDQERDGGNNWKQVTERLTNLPCKSIEIAAEKGKFRTKDLLKLYFKTCKNSGKTNHQSVELLVYELTELKLERAVDILKND